VFGSNDECRINPSLLEFFGRIQAGNRQHVGFEIDFIVEQQTLCKLTNTRPFLPDGYPLTLQLIQTINRFAPIKDPDRFVKHAAKRNQAKMICFTLQFSKFRGLDHAALNKSDLRFATLEALKILHRTFGFQHFERDAIARQNGCIAFGKVIVGATFAATGHHHMTWWRRLNELIRHDKTDPNDQENPPRGCKKVA
jgi:hypothetical protein